MKRKHFEISLNLDLDKKPNLVIDLDHTIICNISVNLKNDSIDKYYHLATFSNFLTLFKNDDYAYFVFTRPHIKYFLECMDKMYNIHIYTSSTRLYCNAILSALSFTLEKNYFNKIITRDENNNSYKNLITIDLSIESTIIIDDSKKVWKYNKDNLIKIKKFKLPFSIENNYNDFYHMNEDDVELLSLNGKLTKIFNEYKNNKYPNIISIINKFIYDN